MLHRLLRKYAASILKRYYLVFTGGYSIGKSYGVYFLFDWAHSLDKKVALYLYEDKQLRFASALVNKVRPDNFYDIGAHAGLYSLLIQNSSPDTKVHAFEPDMQNLCQLYANLYLNQYYDTIQVHKLAVSNTTGTAFLDRSEKTGRGTRNIVSKGNHQVEVKRFDDMFTNKGSTSFFKIDVEGHECSVIEGAKEYLSNNSCVLLIESAPTVLVSLQGLMADLGYRKSQVPDGVSDHVFLNFDAPGF